MCRLHADAVNVMTRLRPGGMSTSTWRWEILPIFFKSLPHVPQLPVVTHTACINSSICDTLHIDVRRATWHCRCDGLYKQNIAETMNAVGVQSARNLQLRKSSRKCGRDITFVKITVNCTMDWTWGLQPASSWSTRLLLVIDDLKISKLHRFRFNFLKI